MKSIAESMTDMEEIILNLRERNERLEQQILDTRKALGYAVKLNNMKDTAIQTLQETLTIVKKERDDYKKERDDYYENLLQFM